MIHSRVCELKIKVLNFIINQLKDKQIRDKVLYFYESSRFRR